MAPRMLAVISHETLMCRERTSSGELMVDFSSPARVPTYRTCILRRRQLDDGYVGALIT